jgi:transmembrane protein TMEM174 (potassium channel)
MIRETISKRLDHDPLFIWRGENVTRVENLSDIVFALALGILVSATLPPTTFSELGDHLLNIMPVAAGFALLLNLWNAHFIYFRRYGLADDQIIFLNACLLLVVLFLAYPLRFIFDSLFAYVLAVFGQPQRLEKMEIGSRESGILMAYFAVGYAVAYLLVSQLYAHALRRADMLALDETERMITKRTIWTFRALVLCSIIVFVSALFTPLHAFSGFFLFLIYPMSFLVNRIFKLPIETDVSTVAEKMA